MPELFGQMPDGTQVRRLTIRSGALSVSLLDHGARVQDVRLAGVAHPLVLGSEDFAAYLGPMAQFGATIGRYANRIAGGRFALNGREHRLDRNEGSNCLHGGSRGCSALIWQIEALSPSEACFALHLPDGHMGFPGALRASVRYRCEGSALAIEMRAVPEADCPLSFAHHSYFRLSGAQDIASYRLSIAAEHYLPVDDAGIPTGRIAPVHGSRFDFRQPREIGQGGYDHCFCPGGGARVIARAEAPGGVSLEVESTAPGLQLYDAAHLPAAGLPGLGGRRYGPRAGLALETQEWPDAPNRPQFPDPVCRAGESYVNRTLYRFGRARAG